VIGLDVRPDALALGARHSCALANGGVLCWGANAQGQLGDGNTDWRARPKPVLGLPGLADRIVAGRSHTCASVDGILYCWGANAAGQLGVDERDDQLSPVAVTALLAPPAALAAGGDQTCAVVEGQVLCWGNGHSVPTPVEGIAGNVTSLAVGVDHGCAVLDQVRVYCWGENDFGQIGSGDAPDAYPGARAVGAWDQGLLRDRDGDGRIVVSCLGDSNTHAVEGGVASWCGRLGERLPSDSWHVINRGLGGATAVMRASTLHAGSQMNYTLENDFPDAVILAFGTNDLLAEVESAEIVDAYRSLALRVYAAGALPFVALTPPIQPAASAFNVRVRELNGALRAAFDENRILDFWSGFSAEEFEDALHLADLGQARRAEIAAAALSEATPAEMR
jgi:lysophospholipase L1-like esterase